MASRFSDEKARLFYSKSPSVTISAAKKSLLNLNAQPGTFPKKNHGARPPKSLRDGHAGEEFPIA
jgi:hypothetical protein